MANKMISLEAMAEKITSAVMIPCFYDITRGVEICRLDGRTWEWPFRHSLGQIDPTWVRANAKDLGPYRSG